MTKEQREHLDSTSAFRPDISAPIVPKTTLQAEIDRIGSIVARKDMEISKLKQELETERRANGRLREEVLSLKERL